MRLPDCLFPFRAVSYVLLARCRELTRLDGCNFSIDAADMEAGKDPTSLEQLGGSRAIKRKVDLMDTVAASAPVEGAEKDLNLKFFLSPKAFLPSSADHSRVGAVVLQRTRLEGEGSAQRAVSTGEEVTVPCQLVLKSIGYKSAAMPGLPFDPKRAVVPSKQGRVVDEQGREMGGVYVTGWLRRG